MDLKEAIANLKFNLKRINSYLNIYIYCAAFIVVLFIAPIYSTSTPKDVDLIKTAQLAVSPANNHNEIPSSEWQAITLPSPIAYTAEQEITEKWFAIDLPRTDGEEGNRSVLFRNMPIGGIFYLGDKEIYRMSLSTNEHITRNYLPIYIELSSEDLKKSHTLYVKLASSYSFGDLEPPYYGPVAGVWHLYMNYLNWNVFYPKSVIVISLILTVFFGIAAFKNRGIPFFLDMFFLSLFWVLWEEISLINNLPMSLWYPFRTITFLVISALLYYFLRVGYSVVKIEMPKSLKYYFGLYTVIGMAAAFIDNTRFFTIIQLNLLFLYCVLNYGALIIFISGLKTKNWATLSLGLVFVVTCPGTIHDFLVWSGIASKYNQEMASLGIPEYFLQLNNLSYLVAIPYLLVTGFTLLTILEEKERYKTQAAIATREERSRIIRDLHDGLGAILTMGAIQAQSGTLTVEKAGVTITESLNDLRLILNGFSTEIPNMASIIETIGEQAKRMFSGNKKIEITYELPGFDEKEPRISQSAAMNLAKITREAITNAAKYSGGTEVHVKLSYGKREIVVEVTDNGPTGFNFEEKISHPTGNGLNNMRSRAKSSGGTFEYFSIPGETTMIATMPIDLSPRF